MFASAIWSRRRTSSDGERPRFHLHLVIRRQWGTLLIRGNQFQQVVVLDSLNLIRENDEAPVDFVQLVAIEMVAQLFAAQAERVPPRMFAEHKFGIRHSYR